MIKRTINRDGSLSVEPGFGESMLDTGDEESLSDMICLEASQNHENEEQEYSLDGTQEDTQLLLDACENWERSQENSPQKSQSDEKNVNQIVIMGEKLHLELDSDETSAPSAVENPCHPNSARTTLLKLLKPSVKESYHMFTQKKLSLADIAIKRKRQEMTVVNHLCEAIEVGLPLDLNRLGVTPQIEELIRTVICSPPINGNMSVMKPIKDSCPPEISYDQIRVVLALVRKTSGVKARTKSDSESDGGHPEPDSNLARSSLLQSPTAKQSVAVQTENDGIVSPVQTKTTLPAAITGANLFLTKEKILELSVLAQQMHSGESLVVTLPTINPNTGAIYPIGVADVVPVTSPQLQKTV